MTTGKKSSLNKKKKRIRIGFDLDGVIIDKPPIIPNKIIEWLYRSHEGRKLSYRIPNRFEQRIRIMGHQPFLRPPIRENIEIIESLSLDKRYKLYAISSRFDFLQEKTKKWFDTYKLNNLFEEIHLNTRNDQPHIFKEKMIKKLNISLFVDDDEPLVRYLKRKTNGVSIKCLKRNTNLEKLLRL